MRMHCLFLIATLAVAAVGCTKPMPVDGITVLSPGRKMRLTVRAETQAVGSSGMTLMMSSDKDGRTTVTERAHPPSTSATWSEIDLPLSVTAMPNSDSLRVTMTVHRYRQGSSHIKQGETKHYEYARFEAGDGSKPKSESERALRDAEIVAVIGTQGRLVSAGVTGKYMFELKKALAGGVKKQDASVEQADAGLVLSTIGVFAAMEDAMAYLPPKGKGVRPGQSWKVRREYVLSYQPYDFAMLTHSGSYSKEEATCRVRSVKARGLHSVATIAISGKRPIAYPESSKTRRVKHFDLKGELEVNLNTGAIEKLRLESTPTWVRPKAEGGMEAKVVEVITLKPT